METKDRGKFRSLELISNFGPHSEMSDTSLSSRVKNLQRERRFLPRLSLSSEQFRQSATGKIFSVTDLSISGMGLWLFDPEDLRLFSVGGLLEGSLNLKREKYPILARIQNLSADRIGCKFENLSQECSDAIALFLNPETLGANFKLIPFMERNTLWYHGPSGTDLMITQTADGKNQRIILYVLGAFIQWDEKEGLTTGRTAPADVYSEIRGIHRLETLYLDPDLELDTEKLGIAKSVVLSSNLSAEIKGQCMCQFNPGLGP
jgi:hypothetical protein